MAVPFSRIHTFDCEVKAAGMEGGKRIVEGTASSPNLDRSNERFHVDCLARASARHAKGDGIPYCYAHDAKWPIGTVVHSEMRGDRLHTRSEIMGPEYEDETADKAWKRIEAKVIKSQSIGFNPMGSYKDAGEMVDGAFVWGKKDGSGDIDWMELSAVSIPMNSIASDLRVAKGLGLDMESPWFTEAALPAHDMPVAPDGTAWDANGARKRMMEMATDASGNVDWAQYAKAFCWQDGAGGKREAYKFPVADIVDGKMMLVWHGVAAAAAEIMGARSETTVPAADIPGIKATLARYYKMCGKEMPPQMMAAEITHFKDVDWQCGEVEAYEEARLASDLSIARGVFTGAVNISRHWEKEGRVLSPVLTASTLETVAAGFGIVKAGRVLSASNMQHVRAIKEHATAVMQAHEVAMEAGEKQPDAETPEDALSEWWGATPPKK